MKTIPQQETEAAGQQPNSFVSQKKRLILSRLSSSSIVTRVAADQDESMGESPLEVRASRLATERRTRPPHLGQGASSGGGRGILRSWPGVRGVVNV
jgi:hypothetical protein